MTHNARRALLVAMITATIASVAFAQDVHNADYLSERENDIVREHNLVRTDPHGYVVYLEEWLQYYDGKMRRLPGRTPVRTNEGATAVREAISYLLSLKPMEPLRVSRGMSMAARDHVADTGRRGIMGHLGSDDSEPGDRVSRHGEWIGRVGENITYGGWDARELVIRLIIDDGHPDRLHRKNIFQEEFRVAGVSFGRHRRYETMCVINYAADFDEL